MVLFLYIFPFALDENTIAFDFVRRVWRYQMGNKIRKSKKDRQDNDKRGQKGKQWSTKYTHKTKVRGTRTPLVAPVVLI